MSQTVQIIALCLVAISCAQNQNAPANPCCPAASQPPPCQNTPTTPPPAPSPSPCPFASTPAASEPTQPTQPTNTEKQPGELTARQPDPNPTAQPTPNYVLVPGYPGIPNMPMFPPYPLLGNYMPIVQDPTTGQRYFVMRNPFLPTNKYSQVLNIYAPDLNPGSNGVPPANNGTSTEKPSDKS